MKGFTAEVRSMKYYNRTTRQGVPSVILNDRSPRAGLPECGRSPHEGRPARGERSLSMAEGTPSREVLFLLYPPNP